MTVQNERAPGGDIAPLHWQGGSLDCAGCEYARLRQLRAEHGCEPGHACMQDACARRIERFFHWHPDLA
ncbi:MAG TPA: 4Fe4S-binding leucine-rich repeat protein, partial [Paraburkholderia sp.]|nr:4Fe4S-binding leucine-rich repeat protein [Paraburkholderia sp.]